MNREVVLAVHAQRERITEARSCVNREVVLAVLHREKVSQKSGAV